MKQGGFFMLEQQLEGMVTIRIPLQEMHRVFRLLSAQNISLHHITPERQTCRITIYLYDFTAVQHLLRQYRIRFQICGKRGLPFFISRLKRRKGLWIGALCCVLLGHFLLSLLWNYEVSGNEQYSEAHIVALAQQYGLWPGTPLKSLDYEVLEHEMELDHPEFTWIQLEAKGTTLCISVKERLQDSAAIESSGSIVAKADGRITELLVYTGTALVKQGDWVQAGQVLVGGWDYPQRVRNLLGEFTDAGEPYAVRAKSVIRGETEHRAIGTCALEEQWLQKTGKSETYTTVLWQERTLFSIGKALSPYKYSEDDIEIKSLFQWGRWQCPIKIRTVTYQEQIAMHRSFTQEEAYQTAVERARRQLQQTLPQGSVFVRESSGMHRTAEDGAIQAEVVWIVDEPIGQMQQIPLPGAIEIEKTE